MFPLTRKRCFFLWWLMCFVLTSVPAHFPSSPSGFGIDKVVHFFLYFVWTLLLLRYLTEKSFLSPFYRGIIVLIAAALYGGFDEWHQQYVNRTMDMADYTANLIGSSSAILVFWIVLKVRKTRPV